MVRSALAASISRAQSPRHSCSSKPGARLAQQAICEARVAEERPALRALPSAAIPSYTSYYAVVRRWSTIRVAHRACSVPAQLMGHTVEARVHPDVVEVHYRHEVVQTMPRLRKEDAHYIDYRHVIGWLVRKPGAFARYRYREDLYASVPFRRADHALVRTHGERADVEDPRILHTAATADASTRRSRNSRPRLPMRSGRTLPSSTARSLPAARWAIRVQTMLFRRDCPLSSCGGPYSRCQKTLCSSPTQG